MRFILGEKSGMTQLFGPDGRVTPVTVIKAGPCQVTQVKDEPKDGYCSIQLGFGFKKNLSKPLVGHLKGLPNFRHLKEFRLNDQTKLARGQEIKVDVFQLGDKVKVTGISKGRGFQGVVKRHGFSGAPASHGHKDQQRMPGSIGATDPQRVFKGMRMAGRMGADQVTVSNLEVMQIDKEKNLLYLKGAVPGANKGLLLIQGEGELKIVDQPTTESQQETPTSEQTVETANQAKSGPVSSKAEEAKVQTT